MFDILKSLFGNRSSTTGGGGTTIRPDQLINKPLPPGFPQYSAPPPLPSGTGTGGKLRPENLHGIGLPPGFPQFPAADGGAFADGGATYNSYQDLLREGVFPQYAAGGSAQMPGEDPDFPMYHGFASGGTPEDMFADTPAPEGGFNPLAAFYEHLDRESRAMAQDYKRKGEMPRETISLGGFEAREPRGKELSKEFVREAAPQAAAAAVGPAFGAATKTGTALGNLASRFPGTTGAVQGAGTVAAADLTAKGLARGPAKAFAAEDEKMPEVGDGRDPAKVKKLQEFLINKGMLPAMKKGKTSADGIYSTDTQNAADKYREEMRREGERKAGETQRSIELERERAAGARAEADKKAGEANTEKERRLTQESAAAEERRKKGEARLAQVEKDMPWPYKAWEAAAEPLGWLSGIALGALTRKKVAQWGNQNSRERADAADAILRQVKGGKTSVEKDLDNIGPLNDFARQGQVGSFPMFQRTPPELPFERRPDLVPPFRPNPFGRPTQDELYNPPRARQTAIDLGIGGGYGLGEGVGIGMLYLKPHYEQEVKDTLAAMNADPLNEAKIAAYYNARSKLAFADFAARTGQVTGGTYLFSGTKYPRTPAYPNVGQWESRVNRINDRWQQAGGSRPLADMQQPREGGELLPVRRGQLPGPEAGQVQPHKMQAPAGQTSQQTPPDAGGPGGKGPNPPAGTQGSSSSESPPKSRTQAEAEFKQNRKSRQGELAAEKRKAKKASEGNEGEGRWHGGSVHHSTFQERDDGGKFAGGVTYPKDDHRSPDFKFPGYDGGGTAGERKQSHWENHQGVARGKTEPWGFASPGYMTRTGWLTALEGLGDAFGAMAPGRGRPIRGGEAKGLTIRDFQETAPAKHREAFDQGIANFETKSGPEYAGQLKFDPGAFQGRPNTPPLYEGEMFAPSLPARRSHYPRFDKQGRGAGNDPEPFRPGQDPYQIDTPLLDARLDAEWERMARASRKPDLTTIEGGLPPKPPGPYTPEGRAKGGPTGDEFGPKPQPMGGEGGAGPDGPPVGGPIHGESPGRADDKPISVASGSYVIPADVVSALGEGNTNAGMRKLQANFPHDEHDSGANSQAPPVPIRISDGEYVITPDQVMELGGGDLEQGHRILDRLVQTVRAQHVKNLKSMPPPAKG